MADKLPTIKDLIKRVQEPLKKPPRVRFKTLKNEWGAIWHTNHQKTVHLHRKYLDLLVSTWIHEKIHFLHPEMLESHVGALELKIARRLTLAQKTELFKEIANLLK